MTTLLLSDNELLNHRRALGAYKYPLYCSADVLPYATPQFGLGQFFVDRQYFLHHNISTDSFIYCEKEQEFWGVESDDHPGDLEEKATGIGITFLRYIKVHSVPYAYDQGAEAKRDDPESAPEAWFFPPAFWKVARSGGSGRGIVHLFCG